MAEKPKQHFTYVLQCKDGTLYTGYTTNIEKRMKMHEQGKGAKYTRGRGPFKLLFQQACDSKSAALRLEAMIKSFPRTDKLQFIRERSEMNEHSKKFPG